MYAHTWCLLSVLEPVFALGEDWPQYLEDNTCFCLSLGPKGSAAEPVIVFGYIKVHRGSAD